MGVALRYRRISWDLFSVLWKADVADASWRVVS